jgi:hypothetical protein
MDKDKQLFSSESVDDDIDLLISNHFFTSSDSDAQLVYELCQIYKEDAESLNHVWNRLEDYSRQQHTSQEPNLQIHQTYVEDSHIISFIRRRRRRSNKNTKYPANRLFTVLVAAIVGLFLVSSLAWVMAITSPATPGTSQNILAVPTETSGHFMQVSLLPYLNNKGIGSAPGQGNFDGSGYAYPANQLPPAGQTILNGVPYQFPGNAPGTNDNIVALGQTIALPQGNYQQASLLVSASWGSVSDKIVIHYTDGSTSSESVSVDDWSIGPTGVVNTSTRYSPIDTGGPVHIYAIQIAMDRTKKASSLTLPMTAQPSPNIPCLHVFALTLQS